jgi:enoyl-CoA hydratase/carnithine racemase
MSASGSAADAAKQGHVGLRIADAVAAIEIARPAARNAMTFAMYGELAETCAAIAADPAVRAATLRGAGDAFVAGTAIDEFTAFSGAEDGVAYESRVEAVIGGLERLPVPTVAAITGPAVGGGLAIAAACDLRIATPDARFGVPIARTVGNCLSAANIARLVAGFGAGRTKRMLLLSELIGAEEALAAGFLAEIVPAEGIGERLAAIARRLATAAPLTIRATRDVMRGLGGALPQDGGIIRTVYGSRDFREGVAAFLAKRPPSWEGR